MRAAFAIALLAPDPELAAIESAKPYPALPDEAACLRERHFRAIFRNPAR